MGNSQHKPAGWHSRRHKTDEAQQHARVAYEQRALNRPTQSWNATAASWVKS